MRYSPGSLVVVVGAAAAEPARFADRVIEERGAVLSLARVRALLAGRVSAGDIEARAQQLLVAAVLKRLQANQSVVVAIEGLDTAERERYVRLAHGVRRPSHLIVLDAPGDRILDEERQALNETTPPNRAKTPSTANPLGGSRFNTALRLGGPAASELKRVVFQREAAPD
jgi:predicted kinase